MTRNRFENRIIEQIEGSNNGDVLVPAVKVPGNRRLCGRGQCDSTSVVKERKRLDYKKVLSAAKCWGRGVKLEYLIKPEEYNKDQVKRLRVRLDREYNY